MFETFLAVLAAMVLAPIAIGVLGYMICFVYLLIIALFGR